MSKIKIYLSASTQEWNRTINGTTEEALMFALRDHVEAILKKTGQFDIYKNSNIDASLSSIIAHSNQSKVESHWSFHSNAGGGTGSEVWHYTGSAKGAKMAKTWATNLATLGLYSRGVKNNTSFYELKKTIAPAALAEHFFHDKLTDIKHYIANSAAYALAGAESICDYHGIKLKSYNGGYLADLKKVSPNYWVTWDRHFQANNHLNWEGLLENWKKAAKKGDI